MSVYVVCNQRPGEGVRPSGASYKCELLENVLETTLGPNCPGLMFSFLGECWGRAQTLVPAMCGRHFTMQAISLLPCPH